MNRYLLTLRSILKAKFNFKNPKHVSIVLFDGESFSDLKYLLTGYNFKILEVRQNRLDEIFISISFIFKFILNIITIYNKSKKNFVTIYFYTLLKIIKPKVIITSIDNSRKFFDLARLLEKEIKFLAVQNANRHDFAINKFRYEKKIVKKNINDDFYLPHFFCFGQLEENHCKFYNINVKNFYKYGSIRVANFFYYLNENKIKLNKSRYDICLISEPGYKKKIEFNSNEDSIEQGLVQVAKFAIKFSKKHNLKLIFANKDSKDHYAYESEINSYKKFLDRSEFDYLMENLYKKDLFSSYKAIFESRVAVGTQSTLLRSKIGLNEKILACNLTNINIGEGTYDFPLTGICSIKNCNYEDFENRLLQILNMSNEDYFKQVSKDKSYTMEFNSSLSTIARIQSKINFFLKN